jgi:hypothetical protein
MLIAYTYLAYIVDGIVYTVMNFYFNLRKVGTKKFFLRG